MPFFIPLNQTGAMRKRKKYLPARRTLRMPEELDRALHVVAEREGVDASRWMREVLQRAVVEAVEQPYRNASPQA